MKLASVRHKNRDLVVAEVAARELVAVERLLALPPARLAHLSGAAGGSMLELIRGGPALLDALEAGLRAARADASIERIGAADVTLVSARAPAGQDLRRRDEQLLEQRAQDQRAGSSGVLLETRVLPRRPPRADPHSAATTAASIPSPSSRSSSAARRATCRRPARSTPCSATRSSTTSRATGCARRIAFTIGPCTRRRTTRAQTERVEQHLSYAGRYKGSDTFGAIGPWLVTKDEIAESRRPRGALQGRRRADRRGQHALLQLQGRRGRELHQPVPHAASGRRRLARHGVQARRQAASRSTRRISKRWRAPSRSAIEGLGTQENPVLVEEKEIGAWRLP